MSSMFGDFADDIPTQIKSGTTFRFKLANVERKYDINPDDPKRNSVTLSWEIVDDGNEDHIEFIGMRPSSVWIPYWDGLTEPEYRAFDDKSKTAWKMGRDNLKAIQRALGYTESEIADFVPSMLDEKLGTEVVAKVYRSKNEQDVLEMKSLAPVNLVQS